MLKLGHCYNKTLEKKSIRLIRFVCTFYQEPQQFKKPITSHLKIIKKRNKMKLPGYQLLNNIV